MIEAARFDSAGLDALFIPIDGPPAEPPEHRPLAARAARDASEDPTLCALVERIANADQKALETLYDATASRVFAIVRGITHNLQCAEDVIEEVYWQVWRQALRFNRGRGSVMAWLVTLARSRAFDHLRRRDEAISHPEPETLIDDKAESQDNPAQRLSSAQRDRCLGMALERLDPLPRQLLTLAFYRGLTHEEIAAQTRLPLGTVKSHIRRGLVAMRDALAASGDTRTGLTS